MAGRQYALSASGGDGELPAPGRKNRILSQWHGPEPYAVRLQWYRFPSVRSDIRYDIIKETGEFVINLTTEKLTYATDFCGVRSGRDIDKFEGGPSDPDSGCACISAVDRGEPGQYRVPREGCDRAWVSHHMFLADVLGVSVDEAYMDEKGKFDMNRAGMMVYSHGEYFGLGKQLGTFGYSVRKTKK